MIDDYGLLMLISVGVFALFTLLARGARNGKDAQ